MPRPTIPSAGFIKPTLDTRFHIDYEWWERSSKDLQTYMNQHLCEEHRRMLAEDADAEEIVDWIDSETGQISRVNKVVYTLLSHCCHQPDYITERTSLIDAVFRALIAVGNRPLTPVRLAERVGRPADTILRTLSGQTIYNGIRPVEEE